MVGIGYFLTAFLSIFVIHSIFFGTGNFKYPMMGMASVTHKNIFIPMYWLFDPTLILKLVSFIFTASKRHVWY